MNTQSPMTPYKGHHPLVDEALLRHLVSNHCHTETITRVERYDLFFGQPTWRIQSYSHAAGALQKPDGTLLIEDFLEWPYLAEYVPRTTVRWRDDEDGLNFMLTPTVCAPGEAPYWHLGGAWPEFDELFDEVCENMFEPVDMDSFPDWPAVEAKLRELGFTSFEEETNW